ncbi:hypothetical protein [Vibrio litoralis]|uniref:hypothetical protein n=1 Tax=Vibrio litoralis TaxID=335972 RepID=UPI000420C81B|nr:hypothetical protein [Vibrio litoralis]
MIIFQRFVFLVIFTAFISCSTVFAQATPPKTDDTQQKVETKDSTPIWVKKVVDAMSLFNDEVLLMSPAEPSWSRHGNVIQGIPKGEAAPSYWVDAIKKAGNKSAIGYTKGEWSAVTAWFVAYPGVSHSANQKTIQIRIGEINLWVLRSNPNFPRQIAKASWEEVIPSSAPTWAGNYDHQLIEYQSESVRVDTDSGYALYSMNNSLSPVHGGTEVHSLNGVDENRSCNKAGNIVGVFVRMKAQLVDSPPETNILLSVGADYYPDKAVTASDLVGAGYFPGAGGSRFQRLTSQEQWFYMANIADPEQRDMQGNLFYEPNNEYTRKGLNTFITFQEFINNHPDITE